MWHLAIPRFSNIRADWVAYVTWSKAVPSHRDEISAARAGAQEVTSNLVEHHQPFLHASDSVKRSPH